MCFYFGRLDLDASVPLVISHHNQLPYLPTSPSTYLSSYLISEPLIYYCPLLLLFLFWQVPVPSLADVGVLTISQLHLSFFSLLISCYMYACRFMFSFIGVGVGVDLDSEVSLGRKR